MLSFSSTFFVWYIVFISIVLCFGSKNEFDTYNANECGRIRRPWNSLSDSERQLYISGILKLRQNGNGDMLMDDLVAIASEHQQAFGSQTHTMSIYLFWHSYILFELESRIRNLGGKYKCFAMPYWDFTREHDRSAEDELYIFATGLGGSGNPNDSFTVNSYSWPYSTQQYWVPAHCTAKDDIFPLCSLKRKTKWPYSEMSAKEMGGAIINNSKFEDYSKWYSDTINLPFRLLTADESLMSPVVTSYDPIWYLFHSMVTLHQALWTNCHNYDEIAANDLDKYPSAYSAYGGVNVGLDDAIFFGELKTRLWSFINSNDVTVRKLYDITRWNVKYDLQNGKNFYFRSGLNEYCTGKLNKEWFLYNDEESENVIDSVEISSSCNGKEVDGLYYIKPTEDGAVIPVICSEGYTMLDPSLNFDSLSTYFTSMYRYGDFEKWIYGTDCSDSSGWRDWFIPANEKTKFRIARNCQSCKRGQLYGDNTAYYMTNGWFCPVVIDSDGCSAKKNLTGQTTPDVMCEICDDMDGICGEGPGRDGDSLYDRTVDPSWCDCYTLQLTPDHRTVSQHSEYCQNGVSFRPNLVIDRSQCTCYQPMDGENENKIYDISRNDLPIVSEKYKSELIGPMGLHIDGAIKWGKFKADDMPQHNCMQKNIYLSQKDFEFGTYRITECGNYVLTEDIIVNFGAPTEDFDFERGDSPNSYNMDNLHWFPTNEQQESGQYFGLNAFWGPFSIGFFAAITIETNYVNVDLNGFGIAMDDIFYLQQRFFAIIEIGNKQFESKQGPVDFGRNDLCIKGIIIRNGVLGKSSHHGIHGSCAKDVQINNLEIKNFDVTGIQCNGCKNVKIENCLIGPQNIDIPVKGRYVHARIMLSRLRFLVDEYGDEEIKFANRRQATTVRALANRLIDQMDMIYYHITQNVQFEDDDAEWIAAQNTFLNPTGWLDGGSAYGILLNGLGTAVVNIGRRVTQTWGISIKNTIIRDIKAKPIEGFWAQVDGAIIHGFFFETIDWTQGNVYDQQSGIYLGDAYTDLLFAANTFFQSDFCPLGSLFYLDGLMDWAFVDGTTAFDDDDDADTDGMVEFRCGSDVQSHAAKGVMGIRIDGVQDFEIEDVEIYNVVNWGDLGSDACGEYEQITFETGVDVDKDIQYGYSGSVVHGILTDYASGSIKNVKIENLESWHGAAKGIALYKGSRVSLRGSIQINGIIAGSQLSAERVSNLKLPNPPPFVCTIFIGPNSDSDTMPEISPIVIVNPGFVSTGTDIYGYDHCGEEERVGKMDIIKSPQSLITNKNNAHIISNMQFLFSFISSNTVYLALFVLFIAMIISNLSFMLWQKIKKEKKTIIIREVSSYGSVSDSDL